MTRYEEFIAPPGWSELFDLLRMRLENEVSRPAVIGIMSATADDGKDVAAGCLAAALSGAGYRTLLVDAAVVTLQVGQGALHAGIGELARHVMPSPRSRLVTVLALSDSDVHLRASQRDVQAAFSLLSTKFDYVIVSTPAGRTTSLTAAIAAVANAILVTVKKCRRELRADTLLAGTLKRLGSRFFGVLALDAKLTCIDPSSLILPQIASVARRAEAVHARPEYAVGEVAEWPT